MQLTQERWPWWISCKAPLQFLMEVLSTPSLGTKTMSLSKLTFFQVIDFIFYFLTLEILCLHHVWTQPQWSSSPLTLCRASTSMLHTGPRLLLLLARSHSCWKQLLLSLFDALSITVSENQDKISCVQSITISTMLERLPGQMVHSWAIPLSALMAPQSVSRLQCSFSSLPCLHVSSESPVFLMLTPSC